MYQSQVRDLIWDRPPAPATALTLPKALQAGTLTDLIAAYGLPRFASAQNAKEDAIALLSIAAEVEHALLVEYLYAAYSINESAPLDLGNGRTSANWQRDLLRIAKQEMAHLITVQNLLRFLGSGPHFDRENFSQHPRVFPFPFRLEPLTLDSLSKYVAAEMPTLDQIPEHEQTHVAEIRERARKLLGFDVNQVGLVYAKLYLLFQPDDNPVGPWTNIHLPPDMPPVWHLKDGDFAEANAIRTFLATQDEWAEDLRDGGMHVDPEVSSGQLDLRQIALKAVAFIAAQGEGPQDTDDSHFRKFLRVFDEFSSAAAAVRSHIFDAATDPAVMALGAPPASRITNKQTVLWGKLFNSIYLLLVLELRQSMMETTGDQADSSHPIPRSDLVSWALPPNDMTTVGKLGKQLRSLDRLETPPTDGSPRSAGAPFELPQDGLPSTELDVWRAYDGALGNALDAIAALTSAAPPSPILAPLAQTLGTRRPIIQKRISDLGG
jgi:hypothetical protein